MLSMTEIDSPTYSLATPNDVKQASQKALNIWVGALSPMWVPFWAATSFGLGAWALTQSLGKAEGLRDLPLASQWPGFSGTWAKEALKVEAEVAAPVEAVVEAVETVAEPVVEAVAETIAEAPAKVEETAEAVADKVEEVAAPVVEAVETQAAEVVAEAAPLIDPVAEVPVVPEVVEAIAEAPTVPDVVEAMVEPVIEAVEDVTPKPVTPKAIAQSVSAVKTAAKPRAPVKPKAKS